MIENSCGGDKCEFTNNETQANSFVQSKLPRHLQLFLTVYLPEIKNKVNQRSHLHR